MPLRAPRTASRVAGVTPAIRAAALSSAVLISAAPELLSALSEIKAHEQSKTRTRRDQTVWNIASAAIAKATVGRP